MNFTSRRRTRGITAVLSAVTVMPSKIKFLISVVMPNVKFYYASTFTLFTHPQDNTLSVTVYMWGVSTNSCKQTWPIWSDLSVKTVNTDMF